MNAPAHLDRASDTRRLAVMCDVQHVARAIWSWGPAPGSNSSLQNAILYHGNWRCAPHERVLQASEFIAGFVPGGLEADLRDIPEHQRRHQMRACREEAAAIEAVTRNRLYGA